MRIIKCDKCGKEVKTKDFLKVYRGMIENVELCKACAAPVIKFLGENNLLKAETNRQ
jgi:protein-arginine kinase activator protein McsA